MQNKTFFLIGAIIFSIIASANLVNFILIYDKLNLPMIVSNVAGIFFNYLIAYMFLYWRKQQDSPFTEFKEPDDIEQLIKEAKHGKKG